MKLGHKIKNKKFIGDQIISGRHSKKTLFLCIIVSLLIGIPLILTFAATSPNTTIVSGPVNPSANNTALFYFSSDTSGASFECSLDSAAYVGCTNLSAKAYKSLAIGSHTFRVRAVSNGSTDPTPATRTWRVIAGTAYTDSDGDKVADIGDYCAGDAGAITHFGCPTGANYNTLGYIPGDLTDTDNDKVADSGDNCPLNAGLINNFGCPSSAPFTGQYSPYYHNDSDADNIADANDTCPSQAGSIDNKGCPVGITAPPSSVSSSSSNKTSPPSQPSAHAPLSSTTKPSSSPASPSSSSTNPATSPKSSSPDPMGNQTTTSTPTMSPTKGINEPKTRKDTAIAVAAGILIIGSFSALMLLEPAFNSRVHIALNSLISKLKK